MADENADRVYVPGAEPAPPARDVEPFWADEPETPVHGRAVPLADRTPPVGMVQVEPGVFRPADGPSLPPGVHVPVPRVPVADGPAPVPPPIAHANPAVPQEGVSPATPWSQPPVPAPRDAVTPQVTHPVVPQATHPVVPQPVQPVVPQATQPVVPRPAPPVASPPPPPVTARPAPDTWSGGHAPAVPPQSLPVPQPPRPAADARPDAPVAPELRQAPQPAVHEPAPGLPNPYPPAPVEQFSPAEEVRPAAEADPFQELNWIAEATPTAEEFARRRLARPAQQSATMGARAMLQKGMFGLVKLAPGQRELEYKQDVEMVRRNFGGLRQVTVVNPKGGAGKTVAVLLLAMTFGQKRGGYVLAWDNNETQGTLGMRAQQDFHARTVRDMMRDLHLFQGAQGRVGDLSQYVRAQGEGMFDVLASDESATAGEMLTANSFAEIRDVVSRFYKLIFVDTGNNVRAENWQASMDATDQLVITMSARNDSAETAARMLDHLEQGGRRRLVRQAVTVVTMPPTRKDIDLDWIQQHFAARTRAVLVAPYERLIDSGEPIRYGELSGQTKDAWLKIAAAVADGL
ncbi:chromosome partitioning protein [Actinoplanes sp. NPDC023801]|uniref:MinD/ParA family ATP-binding protein n=1 Tax=Actinoplanes sp. NPDC023801 TaxID=3154595 RepID=UPI0034007799